MGNASRPSPAFAVYLTALSEWGYTLSNVEKIAAMIATE